jgi:hypothetical protein
MKIRFRSNLAMFDRAEGWRRYREEKDASGAWKTRLSRILRSNIKPTKRVALLVAFVMLATAALAHQDRILSVRADGSIPELPAIYQATRLHVAFSDGDAGALQRLNFLSSGRETSIQPCLLRLVPKGSLRQLFLKGSWYHGESMLPHYIEVEFRDSPSPEALPEDTPAVRFLFSLRDAKVLLVTKVVALPAQNSVQFQDIPLSNGCPA